jgi:hypothetical protein
MKPVPNSGQERPFFFIEGLIDIIKIVEQGVSCVVVSEKPQYRSGKTGRF